MKRFFKTMLSLLIVVIMLAQMFPVQLLVTSTEAAGNPVYQYKAVTSLTPGKTYIVANKVTSSGSVNVLTAGSGAESTASGKATLQGYSSGGNYYLTPSGDMSTYEWALLRGNATGSNANYKTPATYMLQNVKTGAYLFNPVYGAGDGTSTFVTLDPLSDEYSPYTRQVYNSQAAVTAYLQATSHTGYATYSSSEPSWIRVGTTTYGGSNNDPTVYFNLGNQKGFNDLVSVFYMANTNGGLAEMFTFFNTAPNGSHYEYNMGTSHSTTWRGFVLSDAVGSSYLNSNTTFTNYRFDLNKSGGYLYLSSTILTNNIHARVALYYYRYNLACYGANGYYPSHRYPFCQFNMVHTGNYNFRVANFDANGGQYAQQYFYGWTSDKFARSWNNSSNYNNTVFYEKQLVEDSDYTWERVTSLSQIENGAEFVITNQSGTAENVILFKDNGGTVGFDGLSGTTYSGYDTVSGVLKNEDRTASVSTVPEASIWIVRKAGNKFYLQNKSTGRNLYNAVGDTKGNANGNVTLYTMAQGATGSDYGNRYMWSYENVDNTGSTRLRAHHVAQNAGEAATNVGIGYASAQFSADVDNTCYLYVKVYCPHNNTTNHVDKAATCTTAGEKSFYCNDCQSTVVLESRPALGHDYKATKTDATCTAGGYTTYKCSRCNDTYTADHVNALGHAEQTIPGTPATCTSTGLSDGKKCSRCGVTTVAQTTLPKLEHNWQVTSTSGTCGQAGVTNYKCSLCGTTKSETGAIIQHNYSSVVVTPPTCTEQGYTTYTCTNANCGHSYKDNYTDALDHDFGAWYTVTPATTTADGLERRDCSRCDFVDERAIPMLESSKIKGSEVVTDPGQTVTIDFELRGNPGIWGTNFVIYWPESLTFVKLESSDAVFPLGNVEGNENAPVDPETNARMAEYFADAGIPYPGNYMALAYYVDNGGFENNYKNGKIVSITFTLPSSNCLKEYPVGVFGVYASSGNDIINADGDTVRPFDYVNGKITVNGGIDCDHSNFEEIIDVQPTCTTAGVKHKVCTVCYVEFELNTPIEAKGHIWTAYTIIREPSGLSAGISRRTCTVCGAYEDMTIEGQAATGTGISSSVNNETYTYHWTTRIYPGREYMILSNQKDKDINTAYAMGLNENGEIVSVPVEFDSDGKVFNSDESLVWSTATGIGFNNNRYGKWLTSSLISYDNTSAEMNYSNNVYVSDTPFGNEEYTSFKYGINAKADKHQIFNESDMYLAFGDLKNAVAHPDDRYLKIGNYALLKTDGSSSLYTSSEFNWSMEFDFSFGSSSSWFEIFRDDDLNTSESDTHVSTDFGIKIEPGKVSVLTNATAGNVYGYVAPGNHVENVKTLAEQTFTTGETGGHTYDFKHWHHFKVDYTNGVLRVFVDGAELTALRQTNYQISRQRMFFFNTPDQTVGMDNLFTKTGHCYRSGNDPWYYYPPAEKMLYVHENFSTTDNSDNIYNITGSAWDHYGSASATKVSDGSHGEDETVIESNVFYANEDNHNQVFIFEKRLDNEMSTIYQLANGLEGGESYVLVKANQAGQSELLKASDGKTMNVAVREDGVSISPVAETYLPYIDLFEIGGTTKFYDNSGSSDNDFKIGYGSNYEFYATSVSGGFLLNHFPVNIQENRPTEGTFIAKNGSYTAEPSENNVITVVDGKVTIGGAEYYVYKKVIVDQIDTVYENDMAVVDFGFGFNLNADFFRDNDPWADRVDVTLTGVAASINAEKNDKFYPLGARRSGAGTTAALSEGTATYDGGISFANNGAYNKIISVDYEGKVDHLGAYMYSTLYIIPSTSVYYEDNASFITYTNSNNIADGKGAWTTVAGDNPVVNVLDAQYGNSTTHSSYLQYSGNSVHSVQVGAANAPEDFADGWMPSASFTFTGTGFDVISAVGRTTCVIFVEIDDASGNDVDNIIVDNYFGYAYDSETGKWAPTTGENALQLYQVPVINWNSDSATPATYTVKISVAYDAFFDHAGVGYSEFYLDGIRVYNPLNLEAPENEVAVDKYKADKELIISDENLRQLLITGGELTGTNNKGLMFIDGNGLTGTTDAFAAYNEVGAANEITLPAGAGIAFTVKAGRAPEKVSLGVKVAKDGAGSVTVSSGDKSASVSVATATDMYYDVTSGIEWNGTTATVVITNTGSSTVSLTRLKLTTGTDAVASAEYYVNAKTENIAYRTLASTFGVNGEEFIVGDVKNSQTLNGVDTLVLKKYLKGQTEFDNRDFAAADIDGDGDVDAKDAMLLKKLLVK